MQFSVLGLTGEQIRAARALVRIEQSELAQRSRLSLETIKRLERIRGRVEANSRTLNAIGAAFHALGVVFDSSGEGELTVRRLPQHEPMRRAQSPQSPPALGGPLPQAAASVLHRLVYYSSAEDGVKQGLKPVLDEIVCSAAQKNLELAVTGALFYCEGRFLQVLEGPKDSVQQVYGAISADRRHKDLKVLESRMISARQFQDWVACCGRFENDDAVLRDEPALKDGFRPEMLSPISALGLLSVVRDLQALPPRSARGEAGDCPLAPQCLDRTCVDSAKHQPDVTM